MKTGEPAAIGAAIASASMDAELRARLCNAEIQAVLLKYGMAVAVTRTERLVPGRGINVEFSFNFVPAPRGNGEALS